MVASLEETRRRGAAMFAEDEVAASYYARPPYAPALHERLLGLVAGRRRALDVGCGPGKVARVLADHFAEVVALDPSETMIVAGQTADRGAHTNIAWVTMTAEAFDDGGCFDLVTFGGSIHWTDPEVLFPKLARWTPLVAVLGDTAMFPAPPPPCGHDAWIDFLDHWYGRTGRQAPAAWRTPDPELWPSLGPHGDWLDVAARERFAFSFRQSVADFVTGTHSRVSWNRRAIGEALSAEYDAALTELLAPFAVDGMLELDVVSELTWGAPRATPRG